MQNFAIVIAAIATFGGAIAVILVTLWRGTDKIVYSGPAIACPNTNEPYSELSTVLVFVETAVCGKTSLSAVVPENTARLVTRLSPAVNVIVEVRCRRFGKPRITSLTVC
jgi:hypothetical protein